MAQVTESEFGGYIGEAPRYHGMFKRSLYIPMRDGVRLAADIVLPLIGRSSM